MEVLRRPEVAAIPRPLAGRRQPVGRAPGHRPRVIVLGTELQTERVRLLQVIADELVEVGQPGVGVEPLGEPLVELRPRLLRQHLIGGVAEQDVMEAEGLLAGDVGRVGPDQVAAQQLLDPRATSPRSGLGRQLADGAE